MNTTSKFEYSPETAVNADILNAEIDWCIRIFENRLDQYFSADDDPKKHIDIYEICPPELDMEKVSGYSSIECQFTEALDTTNTKSPIAEFITRYGLSFDERIILMMALIPHIRPSALDIFFIQNKNLGRPYTEFGGWSGKNHQGFLPTCETVAFVLAGDNLGKRIEIQTLLSDEHPLFRSGVLRIEHHENGEPFWAGELHMADEYITQFTTGQIHKPDYSTSFPAKLITSKLTWNDCVLAPDVKEDVAAIGTWINHSRHIMIDWGLEKNIKPGYRCLFYGPPGTGKTLTATLIGANTGLDVYRVDLSMVVSKYIGETEKNLANIFNQAQTKNWILFFDEADALFSKRTQTNSSNDRHANQEVAYLLQRIEDCPNVVILASNLKSNIDEAFMRRFQSVIYFPMPGPEQRLQLWKGLFPNAERVGADVKFESLAEEFELSGGSLINAARYAVLQALQSGRTAVSQEDLLLGVRKEMWKEGRVV
jgi:AAA+ superfamily predicted ATPase